MATHICGQAGKAVAEKGQVLLDGPNGIAVTLTPDAAEETGHELLHAATEARRQMQNTSGAD